MTRREDYLKKGIQLYEVVCTCGLRLWSPYTEQDSESYNQYWEFNPEVVHMEIPKTECRFGGNKFRAMCQESLNEKTR